MSGANCSTGPSRARAAVLLFVALAAACTRPPEPARWWDAVDDACAPAAKPSDAPTSTAAPPTAQTTAAPTITAPSTPAPTPVEPRALWSTSTLCPSAGPPTPGADAAAVEDIVLVRRTDGTDLVGVVLDGRSSTRAGAPMGKTLAVVDARTGAATACVPLPFEQPEIARPLLASADPPRIVVGMRTRETPGIAPRLGFVAYDVDGAATTSFFHDVPGAQGRDLRTSAALSENGALALTWRGARVASISIDRRAVTFTAGPSQDDVTLLRVLPAGGADLLVRFGGAQPGFARIDRCGALSRVDDSAAWLAPPVPMQGGVAVWERTPDGSVARVVRGDDVVASSPCAALAQTAGDRVACLVTDDVSAGPGAHIAFLGTDGVVQRIDLPRADGVLGHEWQRALVATRGGVVLATALLTFADRVARRLVAVSPGGEVRTLVDVPRTDPVVGAFASLPPLVTDDGVVVLATWGTLTAVATAP